MNDKLANNINRQCLIDNMNTILEFYDIHVDFKGILEEQAINPKEIKNRDISKLCEKSGLTAHTKKTDFSKLAKLSAPALVMLKTGESCICMPDTQGISQFIFPEGFKGERNLHYLAQEYSGHSFALIPHDKNAEINLADIHARHSLDWFWRPLFSFWSRYAEVLLCSVFINLFALAIPLYTMNIYDRVVINFVEDTLIVLTSGVIVALCLDFFFKTLRAYIIERIALKVSTDYDMKLMERFLHIKDVDIQLNTGEKSNLFRELQGVRDLYASRLVPTAVDIPFMLMFIWVIYMISPSLAIIPIIIAAIVITFSYFAQSFVARYTSHNFQTSQHKTGFLIEMLGGLPTIKMLGGTGHKLFQWQQATSAAALASSHNSMVMTSVSNLSVLITQIGQVFIIFTGAYLINQGDLTVGGLVACSIIYGRAIASVISLNNVLSRLKQSNDVLQTIDKVFTIPHEDLDADKSKSAKGPYNGKIEIKDLTYQYPQQSKPALYKVNLDIPAGERIGLLGKTGAGKSTLMQMITGQITPLEGNMFLDEYVYSSLPPTDLRRAIGYVPQDPYFFSGSIKENILMGTQDISKEALENVIHMAGLDLVIQQTSEGLDMNVGERGKHLSGGQRQSIALARALIRSPDILVFDEPTNAMDNALEHRIKASLDAYIQNRTFILVTHRTTLLPLVSRLVLLDQGRVIADGAKDDILQKLNK